MSLLRAGTMTGLYGESGSSMARTASHFSSMALMPGAAGAEAPKAHFVGSESCKSCHAATYDGWKQTRMANVVRDPKEHPEAVLGDFLHPDPVVTFGLDQVAFVYGSRWKQRYFTKRGDDYYPLPAQWDVAKKRWLPYHVENGYGLVGAVLWADEL